MLYIGRYCVFTWDGRTEHKGCMQTWKKCGFSGDITTKVLVKWGLVSVVKCFKTGEFWGDYPSHAQFFWSLHPHKKFLDMPLIGGIFIEGGGGEIRRGKHFCEICHFSNWLTNFYLSCPVWSLVLVVLSDVITEQILSFKFCRRFKITSSGDLKESCGGVITYRQ